ncbi:MAG: MBL fold metallo-hydrolase [candidate division WOR-3 bacterium]|nr:MAG: MBL fold metallo-hydrolase [candidate division WOR-3 bacterium]
MISIRNLYSIFILIYVVLSCQKEFQYTIRVNKISDRVITYECLNVRITAIKAEDGLIIVDTHRCPAIMSEIKKLLEKDFNNSNYLYIINTHGHWDHVSGNQVFPDSILVGHENCPQFMYRNPANQIKTLWYTHHKLSELKKNTEGTKELKTEIGIREIMLEDLRKNYKITPPTITFADSLILNAGDLTIKLFFCGNAHTNNDIIVHIPEEKVVLTGDMFNTRGSYSFSMHKLTNIPRIKVVLNRIINESSGIEYIIPSHTDIMTKDDLIALRELLEKEYKLFENKRSAAVFLKELIMKFGISKALQEYKEFKKQDKNNYYFMEKEFNTLGKQLFWEGRDDATISVFKIGLLEFPKSALLYNNLADIYLYQEELDSAIHYYEKSLEIFPENMNASKILEGIHRERVE